MRPSSAAVVPSPVLIFILLCAHRLLVTLVRAEFAGIYFDNGMQQSIPVEYLDLEGQEKMHDKILSLLGLTDRPEANGVAHQQSLLDAKKSHAIHFHDGYMEVFDRTGRRGYIKIAS